MSSELPWGPCTGRSCREMKAGRPVCHETCALLLLLPKQVPDSATSFLFASHQPGAVLRDMLGYWWEYKFCQRPGDKPWIWPHVCQNIGGRVAHFSDNGIGTGSCIIAPFMSADGGRYLDDSGREREVRKVPGNVQGHPGWYSISRPQPGWVCETQFTATGKGSDGTQLVRYLGPLAEAEPAVPVGDVREPQLWDVYEHPHQGEVTIVRYNHGLNRPYYCRDARGSFGDSAAHELGKYLGHRVLLPDALAAHVADVQAAGGLEARHLEQARRQAGEPLSTKFLSFLSKPGRLQELLDRIENDEIVDGDTSPSSPHPVAGDTLTPYLQEREPFAVLNAVRSALNEWSRKQGHERCWYYPEIYCRLCEILGLELTNPEEMPSREQFEEGCRRYQNEQYGEVLKPRNVNPTTTEQPSPQVGVAGKPQQQKYTIIAKAADGTKSKCGSDDYVEAQELFQELGDAGVWSSVRLFEDGVEIAATTDGNGKADSDLRVEIVDEFIKLVSDRMVVEVDCKDFGNAAVYRDLKHLLVQGRDRLVSGQPFKVTFADPDPVSVDDIVEGLRNLESALDDLPAAKTGQEYDTLKHALASATSFIEELRVPQDVWQVVLQVKRGGRVLELLKHAVQTLDGAEISFNRTPLPELPAAKQSSTPTCPHPNRSPPPTEELPEIRKSIPAPIELLEAGRKVMADRGANMVGQESTSQKEPE